MNKVKCSEMVIAICYGAINVAVEGELLSRVTLRMRSLSDTVTSRPAIMQQTVTAVNLTDAKDSAF
jgi:hypothetical protein